VFSAAGVRLVRVDSAQSGSTMVAAKVSFRGR
jgi:hypothetical protein